MATKDHMKMMIDHLANSNTFISTCLRAMLLLTYQGTLRIGEVRNLKSSNLQFLDGYIKIHIERAKNECMREGQTAWVTDSNDKYSTSQALHTYQQHVKQLNIHSPYIFFSHSHGRS